MNPPTLPKITDLVDQQRAEEDLLAAFTLTVSNRSDKNLTDEDKAALAGFESRIESIGLLIDTTKRAIDRQAKNIAPPPPAADTPNNEGAPPEERTTPGKNGVHIQSDLKPHHLPFRDISEQIQAAYRVAKPTGRGMPISDGEKIRLHNMLDACTKVEGRVATGNNETVGEDGGFAVQQDISNNLLKRAQEDSDIITRVDKMEISRNSNGVKIPALVDDDNRTGYRMGGVRVYWVDEASTALPSKVKLRMVQVNLKKLMGFWYATDEVLQDASMVASIAETAFRHEIKWSIEEAILFGDGLIQPMGIMSAANGSLVKIDPEGSQTANTVNYQNVSKMIAAFEGDLSKAAFFASPDTVATLPLMTLPTGTVSGQAIFMPPAGISQAPYGTLWGRPIIKNPHISPLGENYDLALLDLSEYLLITKGGVQWDSSIHVQFLFDEIVFRIKTRIGGMPKWEKAITPAKGSTKRSPFVALKQRTGS